MPIKSVKMKISKNKKMSFFLISQGSLNPKIRVLGQKTYYVARLQTDTHTDTHESDYWWHPFRVSGFFLQPIIKDRPKNCLKLSMFPWKFDWVVFFSKYIWEMSIFLLIICLTFFRICLWDFDISPEDIWTIYMF